MGSELCQRSVLWLCCCLCLTATRLTAASQMRSDLDERDKRTQQAERGAAEWRALIEGKDLTVRSLALAPGPSLGALVETEINAFTHADFRERGRARNAARDADAVRGRARGDRGDRREVPRVVHVAVRCGEGAALRDALAARPERRPQDKAAGAACGGAAAAVLIGG